MYTMFKKRQHVDFFKITQLKNEPILVILNKRHITLL